MDNYLSNDIQQQAPQMAAGDGGPVCYLWILLEQNDWIRLALLERPFFSLTNVSPPSASPIATGPGPWKILHSLSVPRVASNWTASLAWTVTRASRPLCIVWQIFHRLVYLFTAIHPCLGFCFVVLSFPGSNSFLIRAGSWDFVGYLTTTTVHQLYQLAALKHVRPRWNMDFRGFLMKKREPIPTANYFFWWVRLR